MNKTRLAAKLDRVVDLFEVQLATQDLGPLALRRRITPGLPKCILLLLIDV